MLRACPACARQCVSKGLKGLYLGYIYGPLGFCWVAPAQGVCFHLYSRARSEGLADFQTPELQRSPLDELTLQVRALLSSR